MPILTGKEVVERWPIIKQALILSAAPTADVGEEKLQNVLKTLLTGHSICWMTGNQRSPRTVIITTISMEEISGTKNMLIYCAHGFMKEKSEQYINLIEAIGEYAKTRGCDNILCYVWNDKLKRLLELYGAECRYTLAVFPLHSIIEQRAEGVANGNSR